MLWVERRHSRSTLLLPSFPNLEFDSYVTIGLSQMADGSAGENAPSTTASPDQGGRAFERGATQASMTSSAVCGSSTMAMPTAPPMRMGVLLAQLTTDGDIGGTVNVQYFPAGGAATATLSLDTPCDWAAPTTAPIRIPTSTAMATASTMSMPTRLRRGRRLRRIV